MPLNLDKKHHDRKWAEGTQSEAEVITFLKSKGWAAEKATLDDNLANDIDVWVGDTPVSIKTQHTAKKRYGGNITFELEAYDPRRDVWVDSWFYTSRSTVYIWRIEAEVFYIDKTLLHEYLKEHGFERVSPSLTKGVKATQAHKHYTNYRNGIINIQTLLDAKVAHKLGDM